MKTLSAAGRSGDAVREKTWYDIRLPVLPAARLASGPALDRQEPGYVETPPGLPAPWVVATKSPASVRKAVEQLGRYFRREFHYDFVPYTSLVDVGRGRVYLWSVRTFHKHDMRELIVGACGFYWGEWDNHPHGWAMSWCWFHPYERRRGHLSRAWPYCLARFPGFICEPPLSDAMTKFLLKRGYFDGPGRHRARKRLLGEPA